MRNDFETGYLEHSAAGTTWSKKGHKYVTRYKGKNGKWVYLYKYGDGSSHGDSIRNLKESSRLAMRYANEIDNKPGREYQRYKDIRYAESQGRKAAMVEAVQRSESHRFERAVKNGFNAIKKILSKFGTKTTITKTSNLYPTGTKNVIKKK